MARHDDPIVTFGHDDDNSGFHLRGMTQRGQDLKWFSYLHDWRQYDGALTQQRERPARAEEKVSRQ